MSRVPSSRCRSFSVASRPTSRRSFFPNRTSRVTYGALREQVQAVAEQLAAAGVGRGDRVATSLTNGLPMIVSFLAAVDRRHRGAAEPGVQGRRVPFLPGRHRRQGAAAAAGRRRRGARGRRRHACRPHDRHGRVRHRHACAGGEPAANAGQPPPTIDDVALVLHTSGSTGRPKRVPLRHANLSISAQNVARSYALTARRRVAVRDAAVPRARPGRVDAGDARDRRHGRRAGEVQPAVVLAHGARSRRHLVFGGADAAPAAARARGDPADPRSGRPAPRSCASSARAAPRCRRQ